MVLWLGAKLPHFSTSGLISLRIVRSSSHPQVCFLAETLNMTDIRYFKSFDAASYPVEPQEEMEESAARSLVTYYSAKYDQALRIIEFSKHLQERFGNDEVRWIVPFTETYDYWPSGRLKLRRLIPRDGSTRYWEFADRPFGWTKHLAEWFELWTGSSRSTNEAPNLSERLNACHEWISQFEADASDRMIEQWNSERAYGVVIESIPHFKDAVLSLVPESNPRISLITWSSASSLKSLSGFDELDSVGALTEYRKSLEWPTLSAPQGRLFQMHDLPDDFRQWLTLNKVEAAYAARVCAHRKLSRVQDLTGKHTAMQNNSLTVIGHLVVWLNRSPTDLESAAVTSILRRLATFTQDAVHLAASHEPISESPDLIGGV